MSKLVKEMITADLQNRYRDLSSALWVQLVQTDGLMTTEFRRDLRKHNLRLQVVKNSLLRRAMDGRPLARMAAHMDGPAALVTGTGDTTATEIAKIVEAWLPKMPGLKMRGALLEGEYVDESRVSKVSTMPTRRDLQAKVVSVARSPGSKLMGCVSAPGGRVLGVVKSLIEKLEKGEGGAAVA